MTPEVIVRLVAVVVALVLARLAVAVLIKTTGQDDAGGKFLAFVLAAAAIGCLLIAFGSGPLVVAP